jgi:hypothetical protein
LLVRTRSIIESANGIPIGRPAGRVDIVQPSFALNTDPKPEASVAGRALLFITVLTGFHRERMRL